jgi:hypothetical protein
LSSRVFRLTSHLQEFTTFGEHLDDGTYYLPLEGSSLHSSASPFMKTGLLPPQSHEDILNNASVRALIKPQDDPFWTGNAKPKCTSSIGDIHLASTLITRPSGASLATVSSGLYTDYCAFQQPSSSTQGSNSTRSSHLAQMASTESPLYDVDTFLDTRQIGTTQNHHATSDDCHFSKSTSQLPHDLRSVTHSHGRQRKLFRARSRSPVVCETCGTKSKNPSDAR